MRHEAYFINDIYLKSIRPQASDKQITQASYATGLAIVSVSILLGLLARMQTASLAMDHIALYGGYIASNVHQMVVGGVSIVQVVFLGNVIRAIVCALLCPYLFRVAYRSITSSLILIISLLGADDFVGQHHSTDMAVLKAFYKNVNPWGLWAP